MDIKKANAVLIKRKDHIRLFYAIFWDVTNINGLKTYVCLN
jgi:hypothetical protein